MKNNEATGSALLASCSYITFLLPPDLQILFVALLGIVLGVILAFASVKRTDK